MYLIYQDNGELKITKEPQKIALESCMQEISLWIGENPMDIENGIDYFGVMDGFVFLKSSVENIVERYKDSFENIIVSDPAYNNQKEILSITIEFILGYGDSSIKKDISIGMN